MYGGTIFLAMICVGIVVIAAGVGLVVLLTKGKSKTTKGTRPTSTSGWTRWIPYVGIALLLAFWSFWISMLLLLVVWLVYQNPDIDAIYEVSNNEKKTAQRVYNWLFWSSLITVPAFLLAVENASYQTDDLVLAALLPLIFHAPLLLGLTSKSAFVYRHTQQGILLIFIRAVLAAIAVSTDTWVLFILGNGALWLFGSIWGRNQVTRSECSLMKRNGEIISITDKITSLPANIHIEKSHEFIQQFKKNEAFEHALAAFRNGNSEIKQQAVQLLETLDEVEQF